MGASFPMQARAQANCQYNSYPPEANRPLEQPYRIASNTLGLINSLGDEELRDAIRLAADQWNSQANTGHYRYTGDFSLAFDGNSPDYPCEDDIKNVVFIWDSSPSGLNCPAEWARAFMTPTCTAQGGAWALGLFTHYELDGNCVPINWQSSPLEMSDIQRAEEDAVNRMMHEFGHAHGLSHAPLNRASIMDQLGLDLPAALAQYHQRDLSRWDITCTNPFPRKLGILRHTQWTGWFAGWLGSASHLMPLHDVTRAHPEFSEKQNDWVVLYGRVMSGTARPCWGPQGSASAVSCETALEWPGMGGVPVTMAEDAFLRDHVLLSTNEEYPSPGGWDWGDHRVLHRSDALGFTIWPGSSTQSVCTAMSGWHTCTSTIPLTTARRMAHTRAYEPNVTVTAWSNQRRDPGDPDNPWTNRRLLISAGRITQSLLPQPVGHPIAVTSVGPGVVCDPGEAGGYDCVAAYVNDLSESKNVHIVRFNIVQTSTRYVPEWEVHCVPIFGGCLWWPTIWSLDMKTGSDLAVWRQTDRWWLGVRTMEAGQPVRVYRSTDGASWTLSQTLPDSSAIGPAVVSTRRHGENQLIRVW